MKLQVVYCNYRSADLSVRERLAFATDDSLCRAFEELRIRFPTAENVIVSTCNRVEIYSAPQSPDSGPTFQDIARFLSEFHGVPLDDFLDDLVFSTDDEAVRHLFAVAASVDSMVVGESQIVSQVKKSYELASRCEASGPVTNALFQRALAVSARVRSETKLVEGRVSIASVAVGDFGRSIFDRFDDKTTLVIGAGEMAEETLRYLKDEGVGRILVCNRSRERAERVADQFGGEVRPWEDLDRLLGTADVIVGAAGGDKPLVDAARFRAARNAGDGNSVFILDLGAPRIFTPDVATVDDAVFLYDIDSLEATCLKNRDARRQEISRAESLIGEETARFLADLSHKATGPIIRQLRESWHDVSRQELELVFRKLPALTPADRQVIERGVERIVNKLLHPPLETLKDEAQAGTHHGLLDAIRRLFRITDP
ncbi:Glutamyl-tRNA reductase [Caulifigura coniformis]|uniref:Glutamyl-tRNA reductase n=1 Tax=Caulifigura coniformis TaxID=2527983 RepID=A0A517SGQ5_9PLAN|nr:glutamyl-tRNA reductase [Caulifigura coniformis]QDT55309.1 Glutamyl-tRNA reductase [Caulifigura coniformis]